MRVDSDPAGPDVPSSLRPFVASVLRCFVASLPSVAAFFERPQPDSLLEGLRWTPFRLRSQRELRGHSRSLGLEQKATKETKDETRRLGDQQAISASGLPEQWLRGSTPHGFY